MLHFLIFVGLIFCQCSGVRVEAEDGVIGDGATVTTDISGFSGTGYVVIENSGSVSVTLNVVDAGVYNLIIGYNGKDGDKNQNLFIDGEAIGEISFPGTGASSWKQIIAQRKLNLSSGSNVTVKITKSWGYEQIDYFELVSVEEATFVPFNIDPKLVNPNATVQAVELYEFLKANFGKKVISGAMTLQGGEEYSLREANWLYATTLKWPALLGLDFMHQTGKGSEWYYNDATLSHQVVRDASYYYSRGGIVHLMWHWRDPSRETDAFYTDSMDFNVENAVDESKPEYQKIITDLDDIAQQLLELQSKGVAVLWRPLHEARGAWFWWGSAGPIIYTKLWKIMYDRFTNYHGLNNLIWVWTIEFGGEEGDPIDWYPGDEYVDIVGVDIYTWTGSGHDSQISKFEQIRELINATKIVALSECDATPDPEEITKDAAYWSFIMPWYGNYIISGGDPPQSSVDFWRSFMGHEAVLTLDKLPGWTKVEAKRRRRRSKFTAKPTAPANARARAV